MTSPATGARGGAVRPALLLAAAVAWSGVHVLSGLRARLQLDCPQAFAVALVVLVVAVAVALAPLAGRGDARMADGTAWALAAVPTALALLELPNVPDAVVAGHVTWWPAACAPVLAALGVRRRGRHAVLAAVAATAAVWLHLSARTGDPGASLLATTAVVDGLWVWALVGLGAGMLLEYSSGRVTWLLREAEEERVRRAAATARREAAATRRAELQRDAVPVLQAVLAAGRQGCIPPDLRARSAETGALLRDQLRAPALLDDALREAVRRARRRGCEVTVADDTAPGGPTLPGAVGEDARLADARALATAAVTALPRGSVAVRRPPDGVLLTVVVTADAEAARAVAARLEQVAAARGLTGLDVDVTVEDGAGEVFAELRPEVLPERRPEVLAERRPEQGPDSRLSGG